MNRWHCKKELIWGAEHDISDENEEQRNRKAFQLPTVKLSNVDMLNGEFDYEIIGYQSQPTIKAPLSN